MGTYLGAEQAGWLFSTLENSAAVWKVISVGQSVAVSLHHSSKKSSATGRGGGSAGIYREEGAPSSSSTAAPTSAGGPKQVHMQLPDPISREDEIDEATGLSKYSLQYVLAAFYAKATAKRRRPSINSSNAESNVGDAMSVVSAAMSDSEPPVDSHGTPTEAEAAMVAVEEDNSFSADEDMLEEGVSPEEIHIYLGVVILSNGEAFDAASQRMVSLPSFMCVYNSFNANLSHSGGGGGGGLPSSFSSSSSVVDGGSNESKSSSSDVFTDWKQKKALYMRRNSRYGIIGIDDSGESSEGEERTRNFYAEVSVGSLTCRPRGGPPAQYKYFKGLEASVLYTSLAAEGEEGEGGEDLAVVASHLHLTAEGKLRVRLMSEVAPIHGSAAASAPSSPQRGEEDTNNSPNVGISGRLLYECKLVTKPLNFAEQEEEEVE